MELIFAKNRNFIFLIDQDDGKEDGKKLLSLLEIVDLEFETTFEDMPELKYLESKLINQV